MRPLNDEETKVVFTKLAEYIGSNIKFLIDRNDEPYVFRLIKDSVYYLSEELAKLATNIAKDKLVQYISPSFPFISLTFSLGICIGKFTKSGRFRLHITSLDILAKFAKHKVWVKPTGEQTFVYGNHVVKAHVGRVTENIPQYAGVIVFSMNDTPLGFGRAAKGTLALKDLDPTAIVFFNQSDIGEYLRVEDE